MRNYLRQTLFCLSILFISGCATNQFNTEYQAVLEVQGDILACETPQVGNLPKGFTVEQIAEDMFEKGFSLLGIADWIGSTYEPESEAVAQGEEVGACVVLWSETYIRTETGVEAVTRYTPGSTSTTTVRDRTGSYLGSATTDTPGTSYIEYVPYSRAV